MTFNWKKTLIAVFNVVIAVYLILAVTAFNTPAEKATICSEVKIDINDGQQAGFLNTGEIKTILDRKRINPIAMPLSRIDVRNIEETLLQNPFVEDVECYKTQSGHVCISLQQRTPTIHVMANNGDNYYLDLHGTVLPEAKNPADMIVATGWISRKYAKKTLAGIANILQADVFWQNQVEQVNVLFDGTIELVPRVGDHILYLGAPQDIDKKLERLRKFYLYGLNVTGWNKYSYISVEFNNQIICKKK